MKSISSIEADEILYRVIAEQVRAGAIPINGVVATFDDRPDNSNREDIIIGTIDLSHEKPQTATTAVCIYIPDKAISLKGIKQHKPDKERLQLIGEAVVRALDEANLPELEFWIESDTIQQEAAVNQHCRYLRVKWNIH